jgi:hypothetical protein
MKTQTEIWRLVAKTNKPHICKRGLWVVYMNPLGNNKSACQFVRKLNHDQGL